MHQSCMQKIFIKCNFWDYYDVGKLARLPFKARFALYIRAA